MNRTYLATLAMFLAPLSVLPAAEPTTAGLNPARPNIIILYGDDMGFDLANGYSKNTFPGELYNLRDDLSQHHNLYGQHPERVKELSGLLEQIRANGQVR